MRYNSWDNKGRELSSLTRGLAPGRLVPNARAEHTASIRRPCGRPRDRAYRKPGSESAISLHSLSGLWCPAVDTREQAPLRLLQSMRCAPPGTPADGTDEQELARRQAPQR